MKEKCFIRCCLYSIKDDFRIESSNSYKKCVLNSEKDYVATVIVKKDGNTLSEVLTGEVFDFTYIRCFDWYSNLLRRYITINKEKHSTEPLHISLCHNESAYFHSRNTNYDYVGNKDVAYYRESVISRYGSIENYRNYLVSLKKRADDIFNEAIYEFENQKRFNRRKFF